MYTYTMDIIEALKEYYKRDTEILLDCLKGLYMETNDEDYINEFESIRKENNLCKSCYTELEETSILGDGYEYLGSYEVENETHFICPICGSFE